MINTALIMEYLTALRINNNKEWYTAHKEERKKAEVEFEYLIQELLIRIGEFDHNIALNQPKELTFKLVRDTRFSSDKSPYNPTFRAHIGPKGKLPIPVGYYISISPDNMSFLGGGLFTDMFTDATSRIRDYIVKKPNELNEIVTKKTFMDNYVVKGTKLKKVPRGYDSDNEMAEYLKFKSYYLEYYVEDDVILDVDKFIELALKQFEIMKPFNTYLNEALEGFQMPIR